MPTVNTPPLRHVSRFRQNVGADATTLDGMELLFGPDPEPTQQAPQPVLDGMDLLFGDDPPQKQSTPATDPNAEPDAPTWLGRRWQDIRGRQDPRYADTPRLTDQYRELVDPVGVGALFGSSDAQMADIIQKQLGDRFVENRTPTATTFS